MITINTVSDKYFTLDGVQYATIYQPLAQGLEQIGIYSIYDTKHQLVNSTMFNEFIVDGVTYSSQALTIAAILDSVLAKLNSDIDESLSNNVITETYTSFADTGLNNILTPRLCRNPISGKIANIYRVAQAHTGYIGSLWMRMSDDNGLTWTGANDTGTSSEIIAEPGMDLSNQCAFYTPSGRLIVIYKRDDNTTFFDTKYNYSDDDGITWSASTIFAIPSIDSTRTATPYSNRSVLDGSGNLLIPITQVENSVDGGRIYLAKSTDNGATWNTSYKLVLDTFLDTWWSTESVISDFGDGHFIIIARSCLNNTAGFDVPIIMYSNDYGENWAGTSETLSRANLDDGDYNSGYLYLEGAGVTLGGGTVATNCLPDLLAMDFLDSKWIVIPYWIRDNGVETYIYKVTVINFYDFLENGVNAVVSTVPQTLFDGIKPTANGGNGSGIIIGNDILYTTVEQIVEYTGGVTNLYTMPIRSNLISKMIHDYFN